MKELLKKGYKNSKDGFIIRSYIYILNQKQKL